MSGEEQSRAPFDEQAALAELERLKQAVEDSRRRRKDASDAFDKFVSSFRRDPADGGPSVPRVEPRASFQRRATPAMPVPIPGPWPARKRVPTSAILAGGAVAIVAAGMLMRVWRGSPESSPLPARVQAPAPVTAPATAPASGPAPAPAAAAGAVDTAAGGIRAELVAVRSVWVRATVDGVRVVERELKPDERVPLRASKAIVIRAGDAGAVRMTIDGQDRGPVGENGVVATRTYLAPQPAGAPR